MQIMDVGHALINPSDEGLKRLIVLFPDGEEVIIGIECGTRFLVDMDGGQLLPNGHRVINDALEVDALIMVDIEIDGTSSIFSPKIALVLSIRVRVRTLFRTLD